MIPFRAGSLPIRVHPLFFLMLAMSVNGVGGYATLLWMISLTGHEAMHILSAYALRVRVMELDLMPFGGAARLENIWGLRFGQLTLVALAGPLFNAASIVFTFALWKNGQLSDAACAQWIRPNATLLLFNLLPALPLDGGRVVYGLLGRRIGQAQAIRIGVMAGRVLAILLVILCALGTYLLGKLNITLLVSAAFLFSAGARETIAASSGAIMSLTNRAIELATESVLPIRWLAAAQDTSIQSAIARFKPRHLHRIAVYDQNMRLSGIIEEQSLLQAALSNAHQPLYILTPKNSPAHPYFP